ncbi:zinc finger protein 320-like [Amphibalanus amphitrite]|uniref:zinc finger protein 320-like n=1 Tax=Amphibalanus amphitrite TaxID=1232801 RepID=UPI001C9219F7|nr:zinc finger protein 320-like [Amphibalanus amphitrite]
MVDHRGRPVIQPPPPPPPPPPPAAGLPSICPVVGCGRSIPNRKRYSEHMAWHRGETVCSLCGRRFSSKSNLRIHQSTLHGLHSATDFAAMKRAVVARSQTVSDSANICPGTAAKRPVSSARETMRLCPIAGCGRVFRNRQRRNEHLSWHRGETVCQICNRYFSTRSTLRTHLHSVHNVPRGALAASLTRLLSGGSAGRPEAPFACRLCDKVFRDASNLSHHTAVHRGETTCRRCFAVLATKRNLRAHLANCLGPNLTPRRNSARAAEVRGSAPAPHGPRPLSSERRAHWEGPSGAAQGAPPAGETEPTLWFQ